MKLINYLGKYDSLSAAWTAIPAGGTDGDYIVIDGAVLVWSRIENNWTSPKLTDNIQSVRKTSSVYGDMHVHHDLSVGGILRARVVRGRNAFSGLFVNAAALEKHHPDPYVGQWALVEFESRSKSDGTAIGKIYRCEVEGEWKATGINGGYDSTLYEALETESEERKEVDADLLEVITTEIAERKEADSTLQTNIEKVAGDLAAEVERSTKKDEELAKAITDETAARTEADATLTKSISDEVTAREAAVKAETTAREAADTAEAEARAAADTAEAEARAAAIEAEANTRSETDAALSQSITDEATARTEADAAINESIDGLTIAISEEAESRSNNDALLSKAIMDEKDARESDVERLSQAVWPLEVTLKAEPNVCEVNAESNVKLSWTVKRKGVAVEPESQALDGESVTGTTANKVLTSDAEKTVEFVYEATYEKMTKTAKASVKFVYASYFGVVADNWLPLEDYVKALEKRIQGSRSLTKEGLKFANSKICYCYPASFGALESVKDGNGYEVIESYTKTEVLIGGVRYLCYLLSNAVSVENVTQIYK